MSYDNWKLATPDIEREPEAKEALRCDECGDVICELMPYFNNGFPVCNYCKVHILKIK